MTPQFPKPSAHDVVTGLFVPNQLDINYGIGNNFGTTIAIMAQDEKDGFTKECYTGNQQETPEASKRSELYEQILVAIGLADELDTGCALTRFEYNGAGNVDSFWFNGSDNQCGLVNYETMFSIYNAEDYKRCVCHYKDEDNAEAYCPQE